MQKILLTFGTRPEAVKMCPLYLELKSRPNCEVKLCVTAQHRQMLDQVLNAFNVKPDYDLNIMRDRQTLDDVVIAILSGIGPILDSYKPDILLVHGDTHTTLAASLAAFHRKITVGHVEAGLRSHNKLAPFPEEVSRLIVDDISDWFYAPTEHSRENLLRENKPSDRIFVTGNTEIDALRYTVRENYTHPELDRVPANSKLILVECHRRENLGEPMRNVFNALRKLSDAFSDAFVIYPVHLNPLVKDAATGTLGGFKRIRLIDPLDVTDFHNFIARCDFILTDSGGIQEDAAGLHKPVLVARDVTERPEGLEAGTLKLVGTNEQTVYENLCTLMTDQEVYSKMANAPNPFGDGYASRRIADAILMR